MSAIIDPLGANEQQKNHAKFDEIKAFMHRRQKYNQFTQMIKLQPFHQATAMQSDRKPKTTPQMPDRRKDSKESASIVTSSVTGKWNAVGKHVTLKTKCSKLDTDNKLRKTTLSVIEKWYSKLAGTQATPPNTASRGKEVLPRLNRSHTKNERKTKKADRDAR